MNFDFSKACDMGYHSILLHKLVKDELAKWTRRWVEDWLHRQPKRDSDRKSNWLLVLHGVSQAPVLAPLLFNVFVSELHDGDWFADDSELEGAAGTQEGGVAIQRDLGRQEK